MKITRKRLLGYGFFAAVLAMTLYATTVPDASALEFCTAIPGSIEGGGSSSGGESGSSGESTSSSGRASVGGNVEVMVKVYSDKPSVVIEQPENGAVMTTATVVVRESYSDLDCLNNTIKWGNYTADLGDYVPGLLNANSNLSEGSNSSNSLPAYGDFSMAVDLMSLGGYGTYALTATMVTYQEATLTDNTVFRYAPVAITYLGTDENGDPVYQIDYDKYTNYVDLDFLKDGTSVLDESIRVKVENPGVAGSVTVTIPAGSYGLESGDYTLAATAYGPVAAAEVTATELNVDPSSGAAAVIATFDYDQYTDEVRFLVIDANGKVLYVPAAVYKVANYGTAGTDTIVIDLSKYDLSKYDFSSYTVIANAYGRPGSTENVRKLDVNNGPVTLETKYKRPAAPDVPDTGEILGNLKISTADYWIFGLLVVGSSAAFAYYQMNKRKR